MTDLEIARRLCQRQGTYTSHESNSRPSIEQLLNLLIVQAIGVVRNEKGFTVITKKPSAPTKPNEAFIKSEHSGAKSSRK